MKDKYGAIRQELIENAKRYAYPATIDEQEMSKIRTEVELLIRYDRECRFLSGLAAGQNSKNLQIGAAFYTNASGVLEFKSPEEIRDYKGQLTNNKSPADFLYKMDISSTRIDSSILELYRSQLLGNLVNLAEAYESETGEKLYLAAKKLEKDRTDESWAEELGRS